MKILLYILSLLISVSSFGQLKTIKVSNSGGGSADSTVFQTKYRSDTGRVNVYTSLAAKQTQLSGTGFIKATGTTISYDNSTYLTTASAAATYQPIGSYLTTTLADGKLLIGNGSNVATAVTPTGDVTFTNAGVTAIGNLKVINAMIANSTIDLTTKVTGLLPDANISSAATWNAKQAALSGTGLLSFSGTTPAYNTTSASISGILSDESGSGAMVFANTPTLVTPNIGVATATSINKVAITAPTTSATLTLIDGSTFATAGAFSTTLTATGTTNVTLPTTGTLATLAGTENFSNKTFTTRINALLTAEQMRLQYDASNYLSTTVSSVAAVVFDAVGTTPTFTFADALISQGLFLATAGIGSNSTAATANFYVRSGIGSVGVGTTSHQIGGASLTNMRVNFSGGTASTPAIGSSATGVMFGNNPITENTSGTHPHVNNVSIKAVGIVNGSASTDTTSSLYIEGATTSGTNNYSLLVGAGTSRLQGDIQSSGNLVITAAAKGLQLKTGTDQRFGNATLVGGTVTVTNASVGANSYILITRKTAGGTTGEITYTITNGTSFTINSASGTDTSTLSYFIFEGN